jgi:hypothetical protein
MEITLSITSSTHDEDFVQKLTRDLNKALNEETEIEASPAKGTSAVGDKGDPFTVGAIVVAILGSGGLGALLTSLKGFFDRSSTIEIELERKDGKKMKLKAADLDSDQAKRTLKIANEFFGQPE